MLQQLADGDGAAVVAVAADQAGQVALDGGVQADAVLGGQLQHHGGHEGLGGAADTEPAVGWHGPRAAEFGDAAGGGPAVAVGVADLDQRAGEAVPVGEGIQGMLQAGVRVMV